MYIICWQRTLPDGCQMGEQHVAGGGLAQQTPQRQCHLNVQRAALVLRRGDSSNIPIIMIKTYVTDS